MGEISEMMLDGTLCEGCGEYIGSDNGYPTYCSPECAGDRGAGDAQIHQDLAEGETKADKRKLKRHRKRKNYNTMVDFITEITDANGQYKDLDGNQIVKDAYKLLEEITEHHNP